MTAKEIILQNLITLMEAGKLDWTRPWKGNGGLPCNYESKRPYSGVNLLITMWSGFSSPYYLTRKQIADRGGRYNGMPTQLVYWKRSEYENKEGEKKVGFLLRFYKVWNAEQITGIEFKEPPKINKEMKDMYHILTLAENIKVPVKHKGIKAFYSPLEDAITLPAQEYFISDDHYAQTFFHELVHSTGHDSRLGRLKQNSEQYNAFMHAYSYEELVAEIGQSFLCAGFNVTHDVQNSAAYIQGWLERIKKEPDILMKAAGAAQKAVNYITQTVGDIEPDLNNSIL